MRAHFTRPVTDEQGDLLPNVQVSVFNPGTTTPITQPLYTSDTGGGVLTNPFVSNTGIIDLYLDVPTRVRFGILVGALPMQYYEDVDVLAAGSDSQHSGTGQASLMIGVGASAPGDNSTSVGPSSSTAGSGATALGHSANALGAFATALGQGTTAPGESALSIGRTATAAGVSGTAVGHAAVASALNSTAIGHGATSAWEGSTAVGQNSTNTSTFQVMLGSATTVAEIPVGSALVISSENGTRWRITIADDGSLTTVAA